jgi:hypothetical protein
MRPGIIFSSISVSPPAWRYSLRSRSHSPGSFPSRQLVRTALCCHPEPRCDRRNQHAQHDGRGTAPHRSGGTYHGLRCIAVTPLCLSAQLSRRCLSIRNARCRKRNECSLRVSLVFACLSKKKENLTHEMDNPRACQGRPRGLPLAD